MKESDSHHALRSPKKKPTIYMANGHIFYFIACKINAHFFEISYQKYTFPANPIPKVFNFGRAASIQLLLLLQFVPNFNPLT